MVEDMPEDEGPAPDSGRAKRAPPTIDLEASEISGETRKVGDDVQPERISEAPSSPEPPAAGLASLTAMVTATFLDRLVYCMSWALAAAATIHTRLVKTFGNCSTHSILTRVTTSRRPSTHTKRTLDAVPPAPNP